MGPAVLKHPGPWLHLLEKGRTMSILSYADSFGKLDPPSLADHDALGALCCTPADHLAGDWLGAILMDLDDGFALDD